MPFPLVDLPRLAFALALAGSAACADGPTAFPTQPELNGRAVKFWETLATTRWNERANLLMVLRPPANGQAAANRLLSYLSIAQHRAVLAAEAGKNQATHPSVGAAVSAASAVVLTSFFPVDAADLEAQLDADLIAPTWPGAAHEDPVSGEAIGREVGTAVVAQAAADNYLVVPVGTPPVGPEYWVSSGAPIVRSVHGARPFFMTSPDQLRPPPPPAYGSPAFLTALAEVRAISDTRTAEQTGIALFWNFNTGPFTAGALNRIAVELIQKYHRTEREAARILAYANAAAFDAHIACWDAKVTYWFLRPSQADPAITLAIALPNHPSYPSGHSCLTGAMMTVLSEEFPGDRARMEEVIELAGLSRIYGGIHYRFDIDAGRDIGRGAAALALKGSLE
jgi:membrane-associated phospholipid phosphatase